MKRRVPPPSPDDPPENLLKYNPADWVHLVTEDPPERWTSDEDRAVWRGIRGWHLYREARAEWAREHGWPSGQIRRLLQERDEKRQVYGWSSDDRP